MKVLEVEGVVINFPAKTYLQKAQVCWEELPPLRRLLVLQFVFLFTGIVSTMGIQLVHYNGAGENRTLLPAAATFIGMCCALFSPKEEPKEEPIHVPYVKMILLGVLEFLGCVFSVIGLNCAGSGIYQVVYASIVVWVAMMSKWFLNKHLSSQQWTAVIITSVGVSFSAIGSVSFSGESINALQFLGIILTLLSTFTYGTNYIIAEHLLSQPNPPSGSTIQTFTGFTGLGLVTIYIFFYTVPNWDPLVSVKVQEVGGSVVVIVVTYVVLVFSAFLHSWAYYKLVKQTGSVSTGIIQTLRAIFVFLLSSYFYCNFHPEQCLTSSKILSAVVVIGGVLYFICLKRIEAKHKNRTEIIEVV